MRIKFDWFLMIMVIPYLLGFMQAPGFAEITSPQEGEMITGLETITGTADHPNFQRYDLAFAYDPNPMDTWFPIGEPLTSPVQDDRLALWDTTGISDGDYQLRLRVWTDAGLAFEVITNSLMVRNYSAIGSLPEAPRPTITPAATAEATAATEVVQEEEPKRTQMSPSIRAFVIGAFIAVLGFTTLATYSVIRKRALGGWGSIRMRRIQKRESRRRGSDRKSR